MPYPWANLLHLDSFKLCSMIDSRLAEVPWNTSRSPFGIPLARNRDLQLLNAPLTVSFSIYLMALMAFLMADMSPQLAAGAAVVAADWGREGLRYGPDMEATAGLGDGEVVETEATLGPGGQTQSLTDILLVEAALVVTETAPAEVALAGSCGVTAAD